MNKDADEQGPEDQHFSLDEMFDDLSDQEEDFSLDELTQAYAQILAEQESLEVNLPAGAHVEVQAEQGAWEAEEDPQALVDSSDDVAELAGSADPRSRFLSPLALVDANQDLSDEDRIPLSPERIVESILFVGTSDNTPVSGRLLASLMRGVSPAEVDQYVEKLNRGYEADGAAYRIQRDDLGYQMVLASELIAVRNRFHGQVKEVKLNQSVIDVLSVVAYHQPIESAEVERLVGRPCGAHLNQLLRRNLIVMEKLDGRRKQYRTTERFLELFGLDEIDDLPQSESMDDY